MVISKLDDGTGDTLTGDNAQFSLEKLIPDAAGDIEYNGVTYHVDKMVNNNVNTGADNGLAVVDNLEFGVYRVIETEAPTGYIIDSTPRIFEVTRDDATFTHVFSNTPESMEIDVVKTINGHDANNNVSAVLLPEGDNTMEVSFTVTNTGMVPLKNVTLTDVTEGDNPDLVNRLIENAMITVTNNVNDRWSTTDGEFTNGEFTMVPGATATVTVTVPAPMIGEMHVNNVTTTGYSVFTDAPVTDDDPAHAYRLPVGFPLPSTGDKALVLTGMILLTILGAALFFELKRRKLILA